MYNVYIKIISIAYFHDEMKNIALVAWYVC